MVDLLYYNGKLLGFTEKQEGIRLFEEDCIVKVLNDGTTFTSKAVFTEPENLDKLTEENVAKQTKELNSIDQFRADVKQFKECGNKEMNERANTANVLQDIAFKTLELNGSGEFVSNGEMLKMQKDYNQVVEKVRELHEENENLKQENESTRHTLNAVIDDQRENLAASRKLRKKHEKEIKVLNAQLDVANAENELARTYSNQTFINQLVNAREQDLKEAQDRLAKLSR